MVVPMFVFKHSFYNPYIPPIHPCIICTIKLCLPGFAPAGRPQSRCYAHQAHLLALGFQAAGFRASTVAGLRLRNLPFRVLGSVCFKINLLATFPSEHVPSDKHNHCGVHFGNTQGSCTHAYLPKGRRAQVLTVGLGNLRG